MASWLEQYDRMLRWYERFKVLDAGRPHDTPSDNYVDEVYAFFQNCYHLKDWVKNDHALPANVRQAVEAHINGSRALRLCADICNALKHLALTESRSGEDPSFGPKRYSLTLGAGVPPMISLKYEVNTTTGPEDAFALATDCLGEWKRFRATWGL